MKKVFIDDIHKLDLTKLKPSELNKIYVDKTGQEYKIKYDPVKHEIQLVKIIKDVIDGKLIKERYDAYDQAVEEGIKAAIVKLSEQYLSEHAKTTTTKQAPTQKREEEHKPEIKKDEETIENVTDVINLLNLMKERLQVTTEILFKLPIFDPRYSFDNKMVYDEFERTVRSVILNIIDEIITKHNDIQQGRDDMRLKSKPLPDKVKEILQKIPDKESKLGYLRNFESFLIFEKGITEILPRLSDIEYKISNLPSRTVFNLLTYSENQRYKDSIFTVSTCIKDLKRIKEFLTKWEKLLYNKKDD